MVGVVDSARSLVYVASYIAAGISEFNSEDCRFPQVSYIQE